MTTLAGEMVLLAYDVGGGKLPVRQSLAPTVRGALLAGLLAEGRLIDAAGTARTGDETPRDAAERAVWDRIAGQPGKSRLHWVRRDGRESVADVLRGLEKDGLLEQSRSRVFGVFPLNRAALTADGLAAAEDVRARVLSAVENPQAEPAAAASVDRADAGLLAGPAHAGGQLGTVLPADRRRARRDRLSVLSQGADPVGAAVRRVVQDLRGAAVS
ncbi:GPP34 family phosphoprotein [Streptomyces lateritius]|uniref:GPP34 family phosphoprotein n=1 Tax=Streptomyces lateritius TaxID=67313 RepID=A0ABW6YBG4_9ACTN